MDTLLTAPAAKCAPEAESVTAFADLWSAAQQGRCADAIAALARNACNNKNIAAAVLVATKNDYGDVVQALLRANAHTALQKLRNTPADMFAAHAVKCGNIGPLQALVDAGHVRQQHLDRPDVFNAAVRLGNLETVNFLCRAKASVNARDRDRFEGTPLEVASRSGDAHMLRFLIAAKAEFTPREGEDAVNHAARCNDAASVRLLLSAKARAVPAPDGRWVVRPLISSVDFAAGHGNVEVLRLLVAAKADATSPSTLRAAFLHNEFPTVRVLLQAKADMAGAVEGESLISAAVNGLNDEHASAMVRMLLRAGAHVDGNDSSCAKNLIEWPLWQAVAKNKPATADLLLAAKASICRTLPSRRSKCVPLFALAVAQLDADAWLLCRDLVSRHTLPGAKNMARAMDRTLYKNAHSIAVANKLWPGRADVRHLGTVNKLCEAEALRFDDSYSRYTPAAANRTLLRARGPSVLRPWRRLAQTGGSVEVLN